MYTDHIVLYRNSRLISVLPHTVTQSHQLLPSGHHRQQITNINASTICFWRAQYRTS